MALKRNETKRLYAETLRTLIRSALDGNLPEPGKERPAGVSWWQIRNAIGRVIHDLTMSGLSLVFEKVALQDLRHTQARLAWALKAFHEARGDLPASLAELVPEYIDAVPLDPFRRPASPLLEGEADGLVDRRDRIDQGGRTEQEETAAGSDADEPTLRLERFLRPPDARK